MDTRRISGTKDHTRARALIVVTLLGLGLPSAAEAQSILNYSFKLPVAKVVPNPCATGFALVTGNLTISISTTDAGSSGFGIAATYGSSGQGQDALANGTVLLNGTANYVYSSQVDSDASFPLRPATFIQDLGIVDQLVRTDGSDSFLLSTVFEISFTNGVPSAPTLQELNVRCQ
jgi:hypothetical protein